MKSSITRSRSFSCIWPWATARLASGTICRNRRATISMSSTRLWTKKICPPRFNSRSTAWRINSGSNRATRVSTARRSSGGVSRFEMSRSAQQPHVQRSRDGRGRHRQHVDGLPQRLQPLLHLHAEPLLLVDNHQPQVVETHVGLGQPVRADDDVERAFLQAADDVGLLPPRGKPRQRGDLERKLRHPLGERAEMLLAQQRGGHQHGHLVAGVDRLERGPHRQFGLAVAHVAAQQAVHRPRQAHVAFDRVDGDQLVGRFVVGERGVELPLPLGVRREGDARPRGPRRPAIPACRRPGRSRPLRPAPSAGSRAGRPAWPAWAGSSCRRCISAPVRSSSTARRASCGRETPTPGALRPARSSPAASGRGSARLPCPTWTTRSPSRSSRKLSITRVSRRRDGRRRSARRNNSPLLKQHDSLGHQPKAALQRADRKVQAAFSVRPGSCRRCRPAGGPRPPSGKRRTPLGPPRPRPIRRERG